MLARPPATPRRDGGNALIVAAMFIALFAAITGAVYVLTNATERHAARQNRFTSVQAAGDAALDVVYGRFSHWVNAHTGLTPSSTDAATPGTPTNASFPAITGAIDFSSTAGLSDYQVTSVAFTPLMPDDTTGTDFPGWSTWKGSPSSYQGKVNKYYIETPNIYEPATFTNALTFMASVTVTPKTIDALHPGAITVSRYFQKSEVSPFNYNIFTVGAFEDFDWGQSFDSEANIYASISIKLDHPGTIINGSMRYGDSFVDPTGTSGGVNKLVFQDPTTGATVDPYTSGLLKQVSKIEVIPDIVDVIAGANTNTRDASTEFTSAADNFSRREIIEPPANLANDTAPQQIQQRRIYTQADARLKVSVGSKTVTVGTVTTTVPTVTGTFYNVDGSVLATYQGTPTSATQTTWTPTGGGTAATTATIAAVNVNTVGSNTPFYDPSRSYDSSTLGSGQPGQPTSANSGHAIESVDVNVGTLGAAITANPGTYANNILYVWDDGASGEKNGVRLYNGGVLPANGLTVGSTDPVYIKGDYNTGTVLASSSDINAATTSVQPPTNTAGWNGGTFASYDDRHVAGYTPRPAGVFGDTVTTLSQNWTDAKSNKGTQYASSTTFNTVMGFGSGDANSLKADDTFASGQYACVQTLEMWNNARWNQLGEQMSLYHSLYNKHKAPPNWLNGGWVIIQNDFDAGTAHVPLAWGYLVFSRGRYARN